MEETPLGIGLICGEIILLITLAAGVALIYLGIRNRKKAEAGRNWPSTQGTVTVSKVLENSSTNNDGHTTFNYSPGIEYRYTVAGLFFTGNKISPGSETSYGEPALVTPILEKYPAGAPVSVYYNPENPSEAVLERRPDRSRLMIILGVILLLINICIAIGIGYGVPGNGQGS